MNRRQLIDIALGYAEQYEPTTEYMPADKQYLGVEVIGINPDVDTGTEDVCDNGNYTLSTSAVQHYISSSHADDTQNFEIVWLDTNWAKQTTIFACAGQVKTEITDVVAIRILSVRNLGAAQQGNVYVYESDTVTAGVPDTATKIRAKSILANNRSFTGLYSIPAGYTGLLTEWGGNLQKAFDGTLGIWIQEFGGAFVKYDDMYLLQEYLPRKLSLPKAIPAKSDVKLKFTATADNAVARGHFVLLMRKI